MEPPGRNSQQTSRLSWNLLWLSVLPGIPLIVFLLRGFSFIAGLGICTLLLLFCALVSMLFGMFEIRDLKRRAVFITGCDTGFGHLLALKCAKRGMPVFAGCLTESGAESLREKAVSLPGKLETIIVDVSSYESIARAAKHLEQATEKYGGLHGVVNNAGIFGYSFFDDFLDVEQYREAVEVNTFGVIRVTQALKHLVKKTRGRIVTVTSAAARLGLIFHGPYCVSKFAASGYCEVIRQELRPFSVSVHIVEPGLFKTPITAEANVKARFEEMWRRAPLSAKKEYGEAFYREFSDKVVEGASLFGSTRLNLVVDADFHALTARFPQLRYQPGVDSSLVAIPISYLPTGLRDAIFTAGQMLARLPIPECLERKK